MTGPFVPQVLSLKAHDKISKVSNKGGLEQATAYSSLLTLHSTITKQQRPCLRALSKWRLRNEMKQFMFLNTLI